MNETDIKYLAGLMDADGSFYFMYNNGCVYLVMALDLSESIDKEYKYTRWLCEHLKVTPHFSKRNQNWSEAAKIIVSKRSTIEMLVPRLLKYLVIKGKHLNRMFLKWKEYSGTKQSEELISELKQFSIDSRKDSGPLKEKSWLPKAYVAGFIDGDGCYCMKRSSGTYNVSTVSHVDDRIVADLLFKQYGGRQHYQDNCIRWVRPLGRSNKQFAIKFLQDMHRHARLKQHKIELFLNYHSQRLNEEPAKAEVIV